MTSFDVQRHGSRKLSQRLSPRAPQLPPSSRPSRVAVARRPSSWMVALPGLPAAVLAAAASLAEIEGAFLTQLECGGRPTAGYALFLLFTAFPVLWLLQTTLITIPAFVLALAIRNRRVVLLAVGVLASIVLPAVASTFFEWCGLPVYGGPCSAP